MPKRKIYMAVTRDALSLPLAVADSAKELAELRGAKRESILSAISRWKKGTIKRPGYIVVEVEEDIPQKKAIRQSGQTGEFDREIFQKRIQQLRQESGMSKTAFAAFTGIAYITLYNYERGKITPGVDSTDERRHSMASKGIARTSSAWQRQRIFLQKEQVREGGADGERRNMQHGLPALRASGLHQ